MTRIWCAKELRLVPAEALLPPTNQSAIQNRAIVMTKSTTSMFKRLPKGPNGGIELLLIQSVDHLGKSGDVVEVKAGYANNYLLPEGLAIVATEHHKRMVDKHKAKLKELEKKRLAGLVALADQIGKQSINIEANANDEGHLYGSVGAHEIVRELKANGIQITDDQVRLSGPLKELGRYTVKIQLHQDVAADLKVWVVPSANS
jgi:large subunit ribosomal protein L9